MLGMFDPVYFLFVGPPMLLAIWAQAKVKGNFNKWSKVAASSRLSGAEAAKRMLDSAGITNVKIEPVNGMLSDHYDPRSRALRLSPGVYQSDSVAAVGIACHEAGHAMQHAQNYGPLGLRSALVPVVQFGSMAMWPLFLGGMFLQMQALILVGIIAFSATVLFQIVTLPVEFDATARAKRQLQTLGITGSQEETKGVNAVLDAAAMTYVAATISALAQLAYFVFRSGLLGGRND